ncbi:hypothetical protein [Hydrogenimonas thermophila]|uniref:Uncharacterized protein n=1 Tax=Hydrogenimonas thermophila TaxID=223786 RepID=A0A1I5RS22_9BACT|nr:hypothetical protein [Hydrogenimonas thermophila]SFP61180.1 hypothetical protein SAMN05216234_12831 [Hydrogenimonas thermophila]
MISVIRELLEAKDSGKTLTLALKDAFGVSSDRELLLARAEYLKRLERLKAFSDDEDVAEILDEIARLFSTTNSDIALKSSDISKAHLATLSALYKHFTNSMEFKIYVDIGFLSEELKEFDLHLAKEILEALKEFDLEFKLIGNSAYEKLYVKLLGLFALYKDELQSSSEFKTLLSRLFERVEFAKKVINSAKELTASSIELLNLLKG